MNLKLFHPTSPFTLATLRSPLLLSSPLRLTLTSPSPSEARLSLASSRVSPSPQAHGIFEREEASTASPASPLLSSRPPLALALSLASRRVSPSPQAHGIFEREGRGINCVTSLSDPNGTPPAHYCSMCMSQRNCSKYFP
jgi:hypothetical protein